MPHDGLAPAFQRAENLAPLRPEHEVAANGDATAAEIRLMEVFARELRLRTALAPIREEYDYIFIDCPPALNLLTVNAMSAADSVFMAFR